jgi:hypothetical protein
MKRIILFILGAGCGIILELIDWLISYIEAEDKHDLIHWFIVFNATFSNIAAISWRPVLVVEEAGVYYSLKDKWKSFVLFMQNIYEKDNTVYPRGRVWWILNELGSWITASDQI